MKTRPTRKYYLIVGLYMLPFALASVYFLHRSRSIYASLDIAQKGTDLLDSGRQAEALAALSHATLLYDENATAHYYYGVALENEGQFDKALQEYHRAIELIPSFASAYYGLGNVLNKQGKRLEARAAWRKVVALPENPWAALAQEQLKKYP